MDETVLCNSAFSVVKKAREVLAAGTLRNGTHPSEPVFMQFAEIFLRRPRVSSKKSLKSN